jgi:transcriptional regulator with XRE-family HTH domain
MTETSDFAKNLQVACTDVKSVSALCRELALNRQQFARYLSGESKPSPFNLKKIAERFGMTAADFDLPHSSFIELRQNARRGPNDTHSRPIIDALNAPSGDLERLKPYVGYYFVYLQSPTEPSSLLKSLVQFYISGDQLVSRWEESFKRSEDGSTQTSRYEGIVRYLNGYLFLVDIETAVGDTILETILRVPYRRKSNVLTGVTMGMTTGRHRLPFVSITAFKFLGKRIDWAAKRRQCGFCDMNSKSVDPVVINIFSQQEVSHIYPKVFERL